MDIKEAIKLAKNYVQNLYTEENISNLGLEEVKFDDAHNIWHIILGFSRPWDKEYTTTGFLTGSPSTKRTYKKVSISDETKEVKSLDRED